MTNNLNERVGGRDGRVLDGGDERQDLAVSGFGADADTGTGPLAQANQRTRAFDLTVG
ncbi:hypothetical protein [Haloarcula sp. JP-L23]|uniref:hypothetical protein n=1 Tax=Haloarcula sp. JP-L23 TaxID=2716717 RepID=UPI00140EC217|nr:hypothetical protein G9465_23770 [Haloarcula sp. JP-L23]